MVLCTIKPPAMNALRRVKAKENDEIVGGIDNSWYVHIHVRYNRYT